MDLCQVYISKKKNGKYKTNLDLLVSGKSKITFKKPKGTYYIKLQCVRGRDIGGSDGLETIYCYSEFTKPVKVKVK